MDDLTKIKGIGKATAKKLAAAGFDTFEKLAAATDAESLAKLQETGFATVDVDQWVKAAADLVAVDGGSRVMPAVEVPGAETNYADSSQAGPQGGTDSVDVGPAGGEAWRALGALSEEEAGKHYPELLAAFRALSESANAAPFEQLAVRISAPGGSFWRAGIRHTNEPVEYPIQTFTPDQAEALLAERALTVILI